SDVRIVVNDDAAPEALRLAHALYSHPRMCPITDNNRTGQSARGQIRPLSRTSDRAASTVIKAESVDFRAFPRLARVLLSFGQQGFEKGSGTMTISKFESFAFAIGFIATGFLTFVALPLAA